MLKYIGKVLSNFHGTSCQITNYHEKMILSFKLNWALSSKQRRTAFDVDHRDPLKHDVTYTYHTFWK